MSEQSEHRYVSVEEFRDDLQRWLSGEPVLACVESWWERLLRWPRRHRMATAALISGLLISVLGGAVFLAVVTQQKNQLAERSAQLQEALRKSKQLLLDANEARVTAEHERAAGDVSRDRAERREQMAFHAISQFYELFTERPELRTSASMSGVREEVLQRSRRFYDQLYQEIEADLVPNQMSVMRLSTAALSLSKLEHDLGHQQQAVERLETAVRRLREAQQLNAGGDLNAGLDFQLARLISQQGQLGMTYSWFDQAGPQLREAVERLESLREHPGLTPEQREEAGVLWVRAMSALAWQLGIMGKTAEALPLAERAKQAGLTGSPVSANDALTRVQLHGNVALLLESSGKSEQSLAELALAEQAAEAAEKLLTKDTTAGFRTELAAVRSKVARSRVRLLQRLNRVDDAVAGLQQQLSADEAGIRAFTSSHDLRNAYGSTAIQLQKQLLQLSRLVEARQVAERWVELAEQMLKEGTETERDLVFLMGARHAAGHTAERCGDLTGAFEQYGAALSVCERTSMLGFRAPSLVYQVLELNCHLACVQVQNGGWSDAVDGFLLSAKQAAEELQRWPTQTEVKPENVLRQLQSAVDLLERLGFGAEAGKWKAELQERQLIP
jgi:tetratricopeptide (TPR) repeat protein